MSISNLFHPNFEQIYIHSLIADSSTFSTISADTVTVTSTVDSTSPPLVH